MIVFTPCGEDLVLLISPKISLSHLLLVE